MMKSSRRHQAGATLLEALAFLGIAAIIVVGAISMFRAAQGSAQANDMLGQLNGLRSSIKTLYATQATYGTSSFPAQAPCSMMVHVLIRAGSVPDTLRKDGCAAIQGLRNIWGDRVRINGSNEDFWISYYSVPQEVCLKIAPQIGGSWLGLQINSNAFVDTDTQTFPVATADAQCTPGTSNTMHFRSS